MLTVETRGRTKGKTRGKLRGKMRGNWIGLAGCVLAFAATVAAQSAPKPKTAAKVHSQTCGPVVDGTLDCPRFGFSYKTIFGWVDRTDDMQPDSDDAAPGTDNAESTVKAEGGGGSKPETLLAVFERPPGAPGDSIDSAVVIVAESLKDYHGVKTAADYFGPITELAEQRGFKVESEPQVFLIGAKQLVRGDFSKPRGSLTMWQSSLVMIDKGYIVSFTFVGGSEDEVNELIENLNFGAHAQPHKSAPPA